MLRKINVVLLVFVSLSACLISCSSQKSAQRSDSALGDEAAEAGSYQVWCGDFEKGFKSAVFSKSDDGSYTKSDDSNELRITATSGTWTLVKDQKMTQQSTCGADGGQSKKETPVLQVSLKNNDSGDLIPLTKAEDKDGGNYNIDVKVLGSVGPYFMADVCTEVFKCGDAHPSRGCEFVAYNLNDKTKMTVEDLVSVMSKEDAARFITAEEAKIQKSAVSANQVGGAVLVKPLWDSLGHSSLSTAYAFESVYADSDKDWNSMTRVHFAPDSKASVTLVNVPSAVNDFWGSCTGAKGATMLVK